MSQADETDAEALLTLELGATTVEEHPNARGDADHADDLEAKAWTPPAMPPTDDAWITQHLPADDVFLPVAGGDPVDEEWVGPTPDDDGLTAGVPPPDHENLDAAQVIEDEDRR